MKIYTLNADEAATIRRQTGVLAARTLLVYRADPESFSNRPEEELLHTWRELAFYKAAFAQFERDGLARFDKESDPYYTFADHAGDCFRPEVNPDIEPAELKRQELKERARFNRQGAHTVTLVVMGSDIESIGGFIGDDFNGSGYDDSFMRQAFDLIEKEHPEYCRAIVCAGHPDFVSTYE